MTVPDGELIVVRGKPLKQGAIARCAFCGSSLHVGRIASPGIDWGIVVCPDHAGLWLDVLVSTFTNGEVDLKRLLHDLGMR